MRKRRCGEQPQMGCFGGNDKQIRVEVRFIGFPSIYDFFHDDQVIHIFPGGTVSDLIHDLINRYRVPIGEAFLLERSGELDPTIQVRIDKDYLRRDDFDRSAIRDGDHVTFLRLMAGG